MQGMLKDIISPCQSVFVKGMVIIDNVILVAEQIQYMKRCRSKKHFSAVVKIDFHKIYDRLSWSFKSTILNYMNFPNC